MKMVKGGDEVINGGDERINPCDKGCSNRRHLVELTQYKM